MCIAPASRLSELWSGKSMFWSHSATRRMRPLRVAPTLAFTPDDLMEQAGRSDDSVGSLQVGPDGGGGARVDPPALKPATSVALLGASAKDVQTGCPDANGACRTSHGTSSRYLE